MAPSKNVAVVSNTDQQNKPPMISAGDITPEVCYTIDRAFKAFFVHKEIEPDKQVQRSVYSFQDHRIIEWLAVNNNTIILMSWDEFMTKFRTAFLTTGWEAKLKTSILAMRQADKPFIDFYNSMAARNLLLRGSAAHLKIEKIRDQLEANMTKELLAQVEYEKVNLESDFDVWLVEVRRIDEHLTARREIDRARNSKSRSAFSEPSRNLNTTSSAPSATATSSKPSASSYAVAKEDRPGKITQPERELLAANGGCFKCRRPFVNHVSGDCTNGFPDRRFTVDQAYIDSFKSKPKPVAAVFDRSRGREESRPRLSGDHASRRSASPRHTDSRMSRRSTSSRRPDAGSLSARVDRHNDSAPSTALPSRDSSPFAELEPLLLPRGPHPVAAVLGSSSNTIAYMASNKQDVLSSEDDDDVSIGANESVRVHAVASVMPSIPCAVEEKLKAPLHYDHLFWRCAVRGAANADSLVPVFDALVDHGAHAVLIRDSLVEELDLKRRRLHRPEEVEGAMSNPGDVTQTTTLSEYVKLQLYCPVSGWGARTVRAIISPSLCAPIILGLPFIAFNHIVVDTKLRTAFVRSSDIDILHPIPRRTETIIGRPPTESQSRRASRAAAKVEAQKSRILNLIWPKEVGAPSSNGNELFWAAVHIRLADDKMTCVRASLDSKFTANLINYDVCEHLKLSRMVLDAPIPYKGTIGGVLTDVSITEYVELSLSSRNLLYTSNTLVVLVMPLSACGALSTQLVLGAPFIEDNGVLIDGGDGSAHVAKCGSVLCEADIECGVADDADGCKKGLPTFSRERVTSRSTLAAVRERIEVLGAQQELSDRGDKIKADFPRLFEKLPHAEHLPKDVYCRIKLKNAEQTIKTRSYSSPRKYRDTWRTLIDDHLATGRIRPSSSPHVSPAFLIPKADPTALPRWVNDYRILNTNTIMDSYPLPRVDEILADCGRGKVFSIVDMTNSFFQTLVHPDDVHLTAVSTPFGLFEWLVMPMGLQNAPSIHQRRVAHALRGLLGKFCHIYIDDIIIWADTVEEHDKCLRLIMAALDDAQLYLNPKKCKFFQLEVDFLGHHISGRGIEANSGKVDRVLNWPVPKSATDVRAFLGLVRYIAAYLPQLAEHTRILTPLTRKEFKNNFPAWDDELNFAFEAIKKLVVSRECLTVIDHENPGDNRIFVTTDASDWRTGAVLSYGPTWESAHPVVFDSMQLKGAELNYPMHEKELLGIIRALKKWCMDLMGCEFVVYTDHRTLENFNVQRDLSRRQLRWQEFLSQYKCTINYIKGEDNTVADALSRLPANTFADETFTEPHINWSGKAVVTP